MIPFRPVIEPDHPGAFLKEHPIESLKNGRLMDIPWMSGVTSHEGALRVAGKFRIFKLINEQIFIFISIFQLFIFVEHPFSHFFVIFKFYCFPIVFQ